MTKSRKLMRKRRQSPSQLASVPLGIGAAFTLKRSTVVNTVTISAGSASYGALDVGFNTLGSQFLTFIQNWDTYRYDRARVRLSPRWNVNTGTTELPLVAMVINYDDFTAPTTFSSVTGQTNSKVSRFDHIVGTDWFTPAALVNEAAGGGNTNGTLIRGQFMNTSGNTASFAGVKWAIYATTSLGGLGKYDVIIDSVMTLAQPLTG